MRWIEGLIAVLLMLVPFFAFKSENLTTYIYWIVITAAFLVYTSLDAKRWVYE